MTLKEHIRLLCSNMQHTFTVAMVTHTGVEHEKLLVGEFGWVGVGAIYINWQACVVQEPRLLFPVRQDFSAAC